MFPQLAYTGKVLINFHEFCFCVFGHRRAVLKMMVILDEARQNDAHQWRIKD